MTASTQPVALPAISDGFSMAEILFAILAYSGLTHFSDQQLYTCFQDIETAYPAYGGCFGLSRPEGKLYSQDLCNALFFLMAGQVITERLVPDTRQFTLTRQPEMLRHFLRKDGRSPSELAELQALGKATACYFKKP